MENLEIVAVTAETKQKGRPVVATSKRQQRLALRAELAAQGIEVKKGRPKMVKVETPVEEVVA
jgi:spore coat polysaccharide biosynthesis protein SpsF (cytidylyltransferase family)